MVEGRCMGLWGGWVDGMQRRKERKAGGKKERKKERKKKGKKKVENNLNINRAVSFPPVKIFFLPNERK